MDLGERALLQLCSEALPALPSLKTLTLDGDMRLADFGPSLVLINEQMRQERHAQLQGVNLGGGEYVGSEEYEVVCGQLQKCSWC
jgi:hypothetical protein